MLRVSITSNDIGPILRRQDQYCPLSCSAQYNETLLFHQAVNDHPLLLEMMSAHHSQRHDALCFSITSILPSSLLKHMFRLTFTIIWPLNLYRLPTSHSLSQKGAHVYLGCIIKTAAVLPWLQWLIKIISTKSQPRFIDATDNIRCVVCLIYCVLMGVVRYTARHNEVEIWIGKHTIHHHHNWFMTNCVDRRCHGCTRLSLTTVLHD